MKLRFLLSVFTLTQAALCGTAQAASPAPIQIGVYYFPGWSPNLPKATYPNPWLPIEKYPGRIPLIGEYDNSLPSVLRKQLDEMNEGRISFVAFDSYNDAGGHERLPQALDAYKAVARASDPKFSLLWANHDNTLSSASDWDNLISTWIDRYLRDPRFLRVEGKPVVFVFLPRNLDIRAATFGSTSAALIARAQDLAHKAGLPGIAFVAGSGPQPGLIAGGAQADGYAALSDYNMGTSGYTMSGSGYDRRIRVYHRYWDAYRQKATLPVVLPITVGWDRSPWGGSKEDGAMSTPEEFRQHLTDAVSILAQGTNPFSRMGVICCWNEFGEGSILEPTRQFGDAHLRALASVLKQQAASPTQ